MERLKQQLQAEEIRFAENESLAAHCTFKIGGPADVFARPETEEQLCRVIALCKACDVKYYLLGNGSNILFEDAGYRGVVVDTTALKMGIGFLENVSHLGAEPGAVYDAVIAGAGLKLSALCKAALDSSLTGLEFAYGIPGTVGGAVYMNAGAYGGEMKDVMVSVTYLTREGEIVTEDAANLDLSYRHSIFEENGGCILSAKFHLKRGDSAAIKARMDELMQKRIDKQPLDKPSAGSTFKRPVGAFAAALIDQCGLRGYRHGGAAVSEKHCGFVVNLGGATCADVLALCDEVRAVVKENDRVRPGKRKFEWSRHKRENGMDLLIVSGLSGAGKFGCDERTGGYRLFLVSTMFRQSFCPASRRSPRRAITSSSGWRSPWMCAAATPASRSNRRCTSWMSRASSTRSYSSMPRMMC